MDTLHDDAPNSSRLLHDSRSNAQSSRVPSIVHACHDIKYGNAWPFDNFLDGDRLAADASIVGRSRARSFKTQHGSRDVQDARSTLLGVLGDAGARSALPSADKNISPCRALQQHVKRRQRRSSNAPRASSRHELVPPRHVIAAHWTIRFALNPLLRRVEPSSCSRRRRLAQAPDVRRAMGVYNCSSNIPRASLTSAHTRLGLRARIERAWYKSFPLTPNGQETR
ncbi:hypothetical protein EXIGLDRAFT_845205 [Exidia glandulosa HHB12029]|uniref:Uncharacterized protein n=1 Tax=Exidia glandulosa HHB12029 TaxID=1314781 RepID=A0A165BKW0_EXIGL|nr:hypothetical protein EXIGLDRAFT_845205 [Exidia glandulosa HHB12029]